MTDASVEPQAEEYKFHGAFLKNEDKITKKKSIVICGITRGGTSFAASVFGRLGVPFSRANERQIGRRYEHRELRDAFKAKDADKIRQVSAEFSEQYPVWAWKLPAIQRQFDATAALVPNPHFVIIFKEPLSVSARKTDIKGKETLRALQNVLTVYQHLSDIARKTEYPMFLISYDRAISKLPQFLAEAAHFAGISSYDTDSVIAGIREDGERYFQTPRRRGEREDQGDLEEQEDADLVNEAAEMRAQRGGGAAQRKGRLGRRGAQRKPKERKGFSIL